MKTRKAIVDLMRSWVGKNEADGSFKSIIDIYNSHKPYARGVKMEYNWEWCACTWSAAAIKMGYTDIIPLEISCTKLIELSKKMGIWVEADDHIPAPGDGVIYDWDDKSGKADNKGAPDHIGMVEDVKDGVITVIEGNYSQSVKRRRLEVNGKYIRGFICPKYDEVMPAKTLEQVARDVIDNKYGSGETRKRKLAAEGWNYTEVQNKVNEILGAKTTTKPVTSVYSKVDFIKDVQKACGAQVDGIAGNETLRKTVTISGLINRRHAVVKPVQKYLYALGYTQVGSADGIAGGKFTSAVKAYQKNNGCVADGVITARNKTWKKLLGLA
jgi:hypothetical protein